MDLTPAQRHFCDHFIKSHNATESYKFAYSKIKKDETAKAAASRLLTNVNVIAYLEGVRKELAKKETITLERCINKLAQEAFGVDIDDVAYVDAEGSLHLHPEAPLRGIDGISFSESESEQDNGKGQSSSSKTKSISLKKKCNVKALDTLMKHLGIGAYGRGTEDQGRIFEANAGRVLDAIKNLKGRKGS